MGDKQHVDTRMFRHAVWYYIHSLFGIRHDDYNYGVINELLERSLKSYVKIVTCFPERVTLADYNSFMTDFKSSEKVTTYS
jgi:sestrin 1/3